jgi:hypothetical protein
MECMTRSSVIEDRNSLQNSQKKLPDFWSTKWPYPWHIIHKQMDKRNDTLETFLRIYCADTGISSDDASQKKKRKTSLEVDTSLAGPSTLGHAPTRPWRASENPTGSTSKEASRSHENQSSSASTSSSLDSHPTADLEDVLPAPARHFSPFVIYDSGQLAAGLPKEPMESIADLSVSCLSKDAALPRKIGLKQNGATSRAFCDFV